MGSIDIATSDPCAPTLAHLRAMGESIQAADVPKEKADLMHAICERITVAGPRSWVSG
jgi:hypothetical protein